MADIFADHLSAEAVAGEVADAWRAEGIEIGREAGELHARRQTLRLLLQHKFGPLPDAIATRLNTTTNPAQLDHWLLQVMDIGDLAAMDWPIAPTDG